MTRLVVPKFAQKLSDFLISSLTAPILPDEAAPWRNTFQFQRTHEHRL